MRPAEFDYKRYQRDKVRKKINQRKFEERMETSPYYQPKKFFSTLFFVGKVIVSRL